MRKYDILKIIFESHNGMTPVDISKKTGIAVSNVYVYLKSLEAENLVSKIQDRYAINASNIRYRTLLDLQAMAPRKFHILISPAFAVLLSKLCASVEIRQDAFTSAEKSKLAHVAIPLRIVLKLSHRPAIFCLKINEALVSSLLMFHSLEPSFSLPDFQKAVDNAALRKPQSIQTSLESSPEVAALCDEFYASNSDIGVIEQMKGYSPDDRIAPLLSEADKTNKEYGLFLNSVDEKIRKTILEQWDARYIYNTNSIEGNTMSEKDVDDFLRHGRKSERISKRELYETTNMRHALDFLKLKKDEPINESLLKELHFLVQKDIDSNAGNYKNFYNYIKPKSPTTPPQCVKQRIGQLIDWYGQNRKATHPFVLASAFHMQFELIHPFADGNGRVGRLVMNHILQQNGFFPLTILEKTKQNYYRALENRSIPQFLLYSLSSFIEEYRR